MGAVYAVISVGEKKSTLCTPQLADVPKNREIENSRGK